MYNEALLKDVGNWGWLNTSAIPYFRREGNIHSSVWNYSTPWSPLGAGYYCPGEDKLELQWLGLSGIELQGKNDLVKTLLVGFLGVVVGSKLSGS